MPITGDRLVTELTMKVTDGTLLDMGNIEVTEFGPHDLTLEYVRSEPTPIMTRMDAEVITMGLVKLSIDVLIAQGYNPRERSMFVVAHAYQPAGKSVTRAPQVRTHGKAMYSYVDDRVTFEPVTR